MLKKIHFAESELEVEQVAGMRPQSLDSRKKG